MAGTITVVGLGPGGKDALPQANINALKNASKLYLRTEIHPVVDWIKEQSILFESFDKYYQKAGSFEEVYRLIADDIIAAADSCPVVYAVPGHPLVAETAVGLILQESDRRGIKVNIVPAMSFLDAIYALLRIDPVQGMQIADCLQPDQLSLNPKTAAVVVQVYNRLVASDLKLTLLDIYPAGHAVFLVRAAGVPGREMVEQLPLYTVDRVDWIDHLTSLYIPPVDADLYKGASRYPLDELVEIMDKLRGKNGCPWDREQDHHTLTPYLLEETYEVLEAIQQEDMYKICEELGDLLLQIVFHAQIAKEKEIFDINDVVDGISQKMIRRHPHVFGDISVKNSAEVLVNWDKIKKTEKDGDTGHNQSILDGVPCGLPSLSRSLKVQAKAARVGFDWPDFRGALDKVKEELREWEEALDSGIREDIENEAGDVLFAVVNTARLAGIDPEVALLASIGKFTRRFKYIEQSASLMNKNLAEMSLEEMDRLWNEKKKDEK
ncbi:tetrapyrrole methylase family protein / MazG family protein [Desulfotomaculum arcticum]|uniref:Tetrapyrrole methylase family protein / MazG family protein n=1 Tax=Desulfotruncus arcticus DSM 17038 TaxID=1121424 RepID=A0A1I2WEN2_9FIRM|nr:nucleoside triphosphate pyrophosphohydrolase [Desulfotruncus arcticus]SFG99764.1 tetrapyrrole methylase family protein / MazG family protein [Desulfotomaculum arcticum] [Desulfotruncus arcticus DSM 17038]